MINYFVDFDESKRDFPDKYEKYKKLKKMVPDPPMNINDVYEKEIEKKEQMKPLSYNWSQQPMKLGDPKYQGKCLKASTPFDRIYNQATTPLSRDYFSPATIKYIQYYISASFRENYDIPLGLQPKEFIQEYMIKLYNDLSCELPDSQGYGSRSFTILLNYTLQELEKRIYKNFIRHTGYLNYLETINPAGVPIPKITKRADYSVQLPWGKYRDYNPQCGGEFFSKYRRV